MTVQVFIVDDDDIVAHLIEEVLTRNGYLIAGRAVNGEEALRMIPKTSCDVILMDITLDGRIDGIDIARMLATTLKIPVIFVTANFDKEILERVKMPTTFGFLTKPFTIKDLVATIEIALFNFKMRGGTPHLAEPKTHTPALPKEPVAVSAARAADTVKHKKETRKTLKDLYTYGLDHQAKGNYDAALQYFTEILKNNPSDVAIWAEKGDVLYKLGKSEDALCAVDTALGIEPANEYAICKKCRILSDMGKNMEALVLIENALKVIPDKYATMVEKGNILHGMGRDNDAFQTLDAAIAMDKKSGYALGAKGRIQGELGMDKEALATFGRALNREPKNVSLWLDLIRIFEQKKNSHLALNILQRALEQNPENEILAAKREKILHSSIPG